MIFVRKVPSTFPGHVLGPSENGTILLECLGSDVPGLKKYSLEGSNLSGINSLGVCHCLLSSDAPIVKLPRIVSFGI